MKDDTNLPSISLGKGVVLLKEERKVFPKPISVNLYRISRAHSTISGRS